MMSLPINNSHLLVLGNGFDLACGLPTTYQDFFNERFGVNLYSDLVKAEYSLQKTSTDLYPNTLNPNFIKNNNFDPYNYAIEELKNTLKASMSQPQTIKSIMTIWFNTISDKIKKSYLSNKDGFKQKFYILQEEYTNNDWDTVFLLARLCFSKDSLIQWYEIESLIEKVVKIIFGYPNDLKYVGQDYKEFFESILYSLAVPKDRYDNLAQDLLSQLKIFESNFSNYVFSLLDNGKKR